MSSPTAKTLAYYRREGYTAQVVERFNPFSKTRKDLFNIIDVIAIHPIVHSLGGGIVGIQACAGASHATRKKKCMADPLLRRWLQSGGIFKLVSWSKRGKAGKRKVWVPRVESVTLADLDGGK